MFHMITGKMENDLVEHVTVVKNKLHVKMDKIEDTCQSFQKVSQSSGYLNNHIEDIL